MTKTSEVYPSIKHLVNPNYWPKIHICQECKQEITYYFKDIIKSRPYKETQKLSLVCPHCQKKATLGYI